MHVCSYDVSGQGMELGLVGRGDMPTAEVIGDGVGATGNVLCAESEIVECGQEPDLAETSLHARNSGTAGVESRDAVCVVAMEEETLSPKAISPELESYHDSEELKGVDVMTKGRHDSVRERCVEKESLEESAGSC